MNFTANQCFDAWFSTSVVKNESGPAVMYHGTDSKFRKFRHGKHDIGFHFGTLDQAQTRIAHATAHKLLDPAKQRLLKVYLRIVNPLRLVDSGDWSVFDMKIHLERTFPGDRHIYGSADYDTGFKSNKQVREYLKSKGYDGIAYKNTGEAAGAAPFEKAVKAARRKLHSAFPSTKKDCLTREMLNSQEYADLKAAEAADAVHRESVAQDSYIAFESWQIKSLENKGTFDPASDDMYL